MCKIQHLKKVTRFHVPERLHGNCRGSVYFCAMAHDHHDHHEPEQNEIGGPVVFALFLFAIVVVAIGMMAS